MTQYDKKVVHRAGMIPYIIENDEIKMMFMKPSNVEYGGNTFQIAKGKVEDGEDTEFAAIREAKEELGLFVGNVVRTEQVGLFMGRTTVYVCETKSIDMFGLPGDETSDVTWMTLKQFLEDGRDLHRPVVQAAYRTICRLEGISVEK